VVVANPAADLAVERDANHATRRGPAGRSRWDRSAAIRVVATAISANAAGRAATVVASIGTADRSVGRGTILVRMIVRLAIRLIGATRGIVIRMDIRTAAVVCAEAKCRDIARRQDHIARAADTATAVRAAVRLRRVAPVVAAVHRVIRTTTSSRARRWLRRRIRITRCEDRGIFCWIIRRRSGRIEMEDAGCGEQGIADPALRVRNTIGRAKGIAREQPPAVQGCARAAVFVDLVVANDV
jgi:hypothetical protein